MSVIRDILRTYSAPREVQARRMAEPREDRAIATLMAACVVVFVAQWPNLAREAHLDQSMSLQMRMGAALFAWVFMMPLVLYGLAALSHLVARLLGGGGTFFRARMALFWALLAASPLWLLHGLMAGFVGPGASLQIVGLLALCAFLVFWAAGLFEAERRISAE